MYVRGITSQTPDTGHTNVTVVGNNLKCHTKMEHVCRRSPFADFLETDSSATCMCEA